MSALDAQAAANRLIEVGYTKDKKLVLVKKAHEGTYLYAGIPPEKPDGEPVGELVGVVYDGNAVRIAEYAHFIKDGMKLYARAYWVKEQA